MSNFKYPTKYQKQLKGTSSFKKTQGQTERRVNTESSDRTRQRLENDRIDSIFGFDRLVEGLPRLGWLLNYLPITMPDPTGLEKAGVDLYFIDKEGKNFKATILYSPYFYVSLSDPSRISEVLSHLSRQFESAQISIEEKQDLDFPNHLAGAKHKLLKFSFNTVNDLMDVRNVLRSIIEKNKKSQSSEQTLSSSITMISNSTNIAPNSALSSNTVDPLACLIEMREYDVPYTMRVSIDLDIRIGAWYVVTPEYGTSISKVDWQKDLLDLCEPKILAFDIECEKSPLKFPNPENDRIFMISYMVANQGYLIINREIVSEDIDNFEYTPDPKYPGMFQVMNVANEEETLRTFINHIKELRPHVIVTYNGDNFDWPYVETRCEKYSDLNIFSHLGIRSNKGSGGDNEYIGRCLVHLDAFCWVQRDSYLPQGNQGLKAVTKHKLGYDPVEIDPEDMLNFARDRPHHMASYSVSDAVATFYLYTTYVHNFIFSLSTIIPLGPEDVLRKGSGTLCEALLMVQAYKGNILCPNKQVDALESFHQGHLLESETYIGGHVECLEAGVFRADIPEHFTMVPSALQQLIDHIDRDLTFTIEVEHGMQRSEVINYEEIKQAIVQKLELLRDTPNRYESPMIYHLDVGAMYPNIILTNRLQPSSMVSLHDCASCKFNQAVNQCKRPMSWTWRGEYSPAGQTEYESLRKQLSYEKINDPITNISKTFNELSEKEQQNLLKQRLKTYTQRVYRKNKITQIEERISTVCMRENDFYVDTVKAFRDRRYDYKLLTKVWKNKKSDAEKKGDPIAKKIAEDREVLMDSLQLAHKCILNSFYGYVMRKGARWRSMEMAGIVTHTGAQLIKQARELVEQVGRPLELDTDGIWCILPASFPTDFKMKTKTGQSISVGYPCAMLNADVHERYTNHQYQFLQADGSYRTISECSIFFELDGPYKAMILPASPEEGKLLKKKYVVYNFNNTIAELKGFELKRRGELELVKIFQEQVFKYFLAGKTLQQCYDAVGLIANQWLDVLDTKGREMDDEELLFYISEKKTISKTVDEYEGRKSTSLTTAGRLADFLGAEMIKDKGLNCNLVISRFPANSPVTDRAIPVAIFNCEPSIKKFFLHKWLKDSTLDVEDFRNIIDWEYYKERLGKTIQKIVTLPAGMQRISNPCPRVPHPPWLDKQLAQHMSKITGHYIGGKQLNIKDLFTSLKMTSKNNRQSEELLPPAAASVSEGHLIQTSSQKTVLPMSQNNNNTMKTTQKRSLGDSEIVDIEDIGRGNASTSPSSPNVSKVVAQSSSPIEEIEEIVEDNVEPMQHHKPESLDELHSWLSVRKKQWKQLRKNRLYAQSIAFDPSASHLQKKPTGVLDFVRNATLSAAHSVWQVIELQELDTPGEYLVWTMTSKHELQRIHLTIPRILYVNLFPQQQQTFSKEQDKNYPQILSMIEQLGGIKIKKDLPHGKEMYWLYEVLLSERKFQLNEKALTRFFHAAEVEGVYESSVPLWFRAVMSMGCVAKVNKSISSSASAAHMNGKYRLQDLEMINIKSTSYLETSSAQYRRIYLYYATTSQRNLGIMGLFFIRATNVEEEALVQQILSSIQTLDLTGGNNDPSTSTNPMAQTKAYVYFFNHLQRGGAMAKPPLHRIYRKLQPNELVDVKFTTSFVPSFQEAMKQTNLRLENYYRERNGPSIVIAQASQQLDAKQWRMSFPALNDFPLAVMPTNNVDHAFPALGWEMFTAERMMLRFVLFPSWFEDRINCSRYAQVPVCNLQQDALTTMIDVSYARMLSHQRHLLWATEGGNGLPDLGQGTSGADQDLWSIWSEGLKEPVLNREGVYRSYSIELDVYGLAICAIMNSNDLDSQSFSFTSATTASKTASIFADSEVNNHTTDENAIESMIGVQSAAAFSDVSCGRAFNILKALVTKYVEEVTRNQDRMADSILTSFYRYLCGYGQGLLADPLLHRTVHSLMAKLFTRLITSFESLGVKVIYADFNRVIISAVDKYTETEAKEYIDFILSAISTQPLYHYLQISIKKYWQQLIWFDRDNWTGFDFKEPVEEPEPIEEEPIVTTNNLIPSTPITLQKKKVQVEEKEEEENDAEFEDSKEAKNSSPTEGTPNKTLVKGSSPLKQPGQKNLSSIWAAFKPTNPKLSDPVVVAAPSKSKNARLFEDNEDDDFVTEGKGDDDASDAPSDDDSEEFIDEDDEQGAYSSHYKPKAYKDISELLDSFEDTSSPYEGTTNVNKSKKQTSTHRLGKQFLSSGNNLAVTENPYEGEEEDNEDDYYEEPEDPSLDQNWNITQTILKGPAASFFLFILSEFILRFHSSLEQGHSPEEAHQEMREWIEKNLTNTMFKTIDDLHISYSQMANSSNTANHRIIVEFVKLVCHIFSLDQPLKEPVFAMKRLLLTQLQVQEFSVESEFKNSSSSYILRDVICSYCSMCRDIDLLREQITVVDELTHATIWKCSHCNHDLNSEELENRLIGELDKLTARYLLQDFRCPKTHQVAKRLASAYSLQSVPLVMDFTQDQMIYELNLLKEVAEIHKFPYLLNSLQEYF